MRVWITSVLVLFGMVELYQWMKGFTLPLPVFILGGALLAIASNYGKYGKVANWFSSLTATSLDGTPAKTSTGGSSTTSVNYSNLNSSSATSLPNSTRSISFTIRRPMQQEVNNDSL
ncbi:MAG TPA: hypothetical protein V6C91_10435 [Coleofasciculaceae cyanobacterium]